MLLWLLVIGGIVLALAAVVLLIVAMRQADRRARRSLFRALGLADDTVELLMSRSGDVLAELALVRRHVPTTADETHVPTETLLRRAQPAIRFLHPIEGGAVDPAAGPAAAEPRARAARRRRLPHPGRQGRP